MVAVREPIFLQMGACVLFRSCVLAVREHIIWVRMVILASNLGQEGLLLPCFGGVRHKFACWARCFRLALVQDQAAEHFGEINLDKVRNKMTHSPVTIANTHDPMLR